MPSVDEVGRKENDHHEENHPEKKPGEGTDGKKFDQYLQSKQLNRSKKENIPEKNPLGVNGKVAEKEVVRHAAPLEEKPRFARVEEDELRIGGGALRGMPPPPGGQVRQMSQGEGLQGGRQPPPPAPGRDRDHLQLPGGPAMEKVVVKHLDNIEKEVEKRRVEEREGVLRHGHHHGRQQELRKEAGDQRDPGVEPRGKAAGEANDGHVAGRCF